MVRSLVPADRLNICHVNSNDGSAEYESGVAYQAGEVVIFHNKTYVAAIDIEETDTDKPDEAPAKWALSPDAFTSGGGGGDLEERVAALESEMSDKVDKVAGKGLSENDYTDADKAIVDGVTAALADKVDKVSGKGLSENDYTDADKAIVDGVTAALAVKVDKVSGKGLSTNDFTDALKDKLTALYDGGYELKGSYSVSTPAVTGTHTFQKELFDLAALFLAAINNLADDEFILTKGLFVTGYADMMLQPQVYEKNATQLHLRALSTQLSTTQVSLSSAYIDSSTEANTRYTIVGFTSSNALNYADVTLSNQPSSGGSNNISYFIFKKLKS